MTPKTRHPQTILRNTAAQLAALVMIFVSGNIAAQMPLTDVATIAAGRRHSCVVTIAGGAKCWGDNFNGQLGDNSIIERRTPVDVLGLSAGVSAITAGIGHTCALTTTGGVKCWGLNFFSQLGDNSTTQRLTAVDVSGLASGVSAIAAGDLHTCALTATGAVKCWGSNGLGELGDNTTTQRLTPVDVSGLMSGVAAIAAGGKHTCALTAAGGVKCWGFNLFGQLGDNSNFGSLTPVDVAGLTSGVSALSTGGLHTCALTSGGGVKCWGYNSRGAVGDNTTINRLTPVDVTGLTSGVSALAAGNEGTCAITNSGSAKCWGANSAGQLGDNTFTQRNAPVDVSGLATGVRAIATSWFHTCALTSGGGVKCWGSNEFGSLGDNQPVNRLTPVDALGLTAGMSAVTAGSRHSCALTTSGGAKCWGNNNSGQLGDNSTTQRLTTIDVSGLASGVSAIAAGDAHTCALTSSGGVKCWGDNSFGQLGDNTTTQRLTPVDVSSLTSAVAAIAAGVSHTCALTAAGGVKCWGFNGFGQLGDNSTTNRSIPTDVAGLTSGVSAIKAAYSHTCALMQGGGVKCWGDNGVGELGDNTTTQRLTPADVSGLMSGIGAIAASGTHTCALTTGGGVKCWGSNNVGALGDNTIINRSTPVDVFGLASGVSIVAAGGGHSCALTSDGGAKCWGNNFSGQVGDNSVNNRLVPTDVVALASGVTTIAPGGGHTCALTSVGGVKCWGNNLNGALGDGTAGLRPFPGAVLVVTDTLSAVKSRKTHGAAGTFDLVLDTTPLIAGAVSVESRTIGGGHLIVFQFTAPVSATGTANAVGSNAMPIGTTAVSSLNNEVSVTLNGIPDNSRVTISLTGVNGTDNVSASIGFLIGDVNNTRSVNSSDISSVKARSGQTTNATNFKFDVNATGSINSSDISAVKARSGLVLAP